MPTPIAVLDFGAQYAHLIANRIRRLKAYSEIFPHSISATSLKEKNVAGIILSGGPKSVYDQDGLHIDPEILELNVPILGICYGHQLLVHTLKGEVQRGKVHEFGKSTFHPLKQESLLQGFPESSTVWMSHVDKVMQLPEGFEIIGSTSDCKKAAIQNKEKNIFGVQFHPEVTHTEKGMLLLENFIRICGMEDSWEMNNFVDAEIEKIRTQAKGKNVFLLVSGGVDSSVAFALLEKALGKERVYGLFVDHGLLRKNEREEVTANLNLAGFTNLHVVDASEKFLQNLEGIIDPEEKRKIIGDTFLKVQEEVTAELNLNPNEWLLGQGTIYPDTIESGGTKHAAKIKTHHNRVEKIQKLIDEGKIIEPVQELYKDEVREVGRELGLPEKMVTRHPFPGPGLGVRILCAEKADELENAEEIEEKIQKKFPEVRAKVLPIRSVGVQGDFRSYRHPVAIQVKSQKSKVKSGEKKDVLPLSGGVRGGSRDDLKGVSWDRIDEIASAIPNAFPELNRVLLSLAPVSTPSVKTGTLTKKRITLLQEADAIVREILEAEDFEGKEDIWQFPVVLCPISVGVQNFEPLQESIILRPVSSREAMTASFARIPWEVVEQMNSEIMEKLQGKVSAVFYDVTNKPPGTIEWE